MLRLFAQVSEAHELHGAKHQDWQRYSKHCSSITRSIRKKHPKLLGCSANGRFIGKSVPTIAKCLTTSLPDSMELAVWEAEKAWSDFMGCRERIQKYGSSASSPSSRQSRHARRRLGVSLRYAKSASEIASKLIEHSEEKKFQLFHAECISYLNWIEALAANELKNWQECFKKSSIAIKILEQLEINSIYQKRIETFLNPLLKFSAYNLKKEGRAEPIVEFPAFIQGISQLSIESKETTQLGPSEQALLVECLGWVRKILSNPSYRIPSSKLDNLMGKFDQLLRSKAEFEERELVKKVELFLHSVKLWTVAQNQKSGDEQVRISMLAIDLLSKLKVEAEELSSKSFKIDDKSNGNSLILRVENLSSAINETLSRLIVKSSKFKSSLERLKITTDKQFQFVECKPIYFDLAYNYI